MTTFKVGQKILLLAFGIVFISAFPTDEKLEELAPADSNREADNRGRAWSAWSSASHTNRGRFNGKSGNVDNLNSNGTVSQEPMANQTEANATEAPSVEGKEPVTVILPGGTTVPSPSSTATTVAPPPCGGNLQQLPPPVPVVPIGPGPNIGNGYPPLESLVQQVAGNHGKNETQQQIIVLLVPMREQQPVAPVGAGDLRSLNEMAPRSAEEEPDQGGMML